MTTSTRRVLLVDDEPAVLDALCRQHRKSFDLERACGVEAGLKAVRADASVAVVVSDYQMPGMNGADFLAEVQKARPEIVRVMLTGQADVRTASDAVNRGNIFRFLTKPCEPDHFRSTLQAAIEQYELIHAEKLLLEHTVKGSVEVLADVLALSNPIAFGRSTRIRHYVKHVVAALNLANSWQYETAALLSQIGCVALPNDIFDRMCRGETLPPQELAMVEDHPRLARELLLKIPRLEGVAEMVYHQQRRDAPDPDLDSEIRLGSRILAAALEYEELLSLGATPKQASAALRSAPGKHHEKIVAALESSSIKSLSEQVAQCTLRKLEPGMVLDEDVRNCNDALVVPRGHELTQSSLAKLRNHSDLGLLSKTRFRVRPAVDASDDGAAAA